MFPLGDIPQARLLFLEPRESTEDLSAFPFLGEDLIAFSFCFSKAYLMVPGTSASYHFFFFFFFFVGQGGGSAADCTTSQGGEVVSQPLQLTGLWSGAPSSGTACSLELSLPSPAGIWFKTLLPVGGTNTAPPTTMRKSELVSRHPSTDGLGLQGFSGQKCGGRQRSERPRNTH